MAHQMNDPLTTADIIRIRRDAERMRSEALRETFAALGRTVSRLFGTSTLGSEQHAA